MQPTIFPLGDSALTITLGSIIDEEINNKVHALFSLFKKENFPGITDVIPAYASVTVIYDALEVKKVCNCSAYAHVLGLATKALDNVSAAIKNQPKKIEVPVCYDVSVGFDLEEMSIEKKISIEEIIHLHVGKTYRVYMIGFLPGFAYMGSVDPQIVTPRKQVPATKIPAGSVGIAGEQTGIYPLDSPGGWNIIGRTPSLLFNVSSDNPCLFQPGDTVQFYSISLDEFNQIKLQQ